MPRKLLIKRWLFSCCFMVILMILLGGITRLTDSGLSIVEWKPITGIIPPLSTASWQEEFAKYQNFPEYHYRNVTMAEFKCIFWLEFIHRFAGRLTGLIYLLPLIYFLINKQLDKKAIFTYFIVLLLFFAQGFMGWYMVQSGLNLHPYVSHFRLSGHLIIAVIIYNLLFYQLMKNSFDILPVAEVKFTTLKIFCLVSLLSLYIQIMLGGLVAGLDAGLVYNSFPLMGNNFIPEEVMSENFNIQSFNDPAIVQFFHRMGAYIVCASTLLLVISLIKSGHARLQKVAYSIIVLLILQMLAGIITVLYSVPTLVALMHQILAVMLLSSLSWCYFLLSPFKEPLLRYDNIER